MVQGLLLEFELETLRRALEIWESSDVIVLDSDLSSKWNLRVEDLNTSLLLFLGISGVFSLG
jgi:hypothetical protein